MAIENENNNKVVVTSVADWLRQAGVGTGGRPARRKVQAAAEVDKGGRPRGAGLTYRGNPINRLGFKSHELGEGRKRQIVRNAIAAGGPNAWRDLPVSDLPQSRINPLTGTHKVDAPKPENFGTEGEYLEARDKHVTSKNSGAPELEHSHPWNLAHTYDPTQDMSIRSEYRKNLQVNPGVGEGRSSSAAKSRVRKIVSVLKAQMPSHRFSFAPVAGAHTWEVWSSPASCADCKKVRGRSKFDAPPAPEEDVPAADLSGLTVKSPTQFETPAPVAKPVAAPVAKPPVKKTTSKNAKSKARLDQQRKMIEALIEEKAKRLKG